MKYISYTFIDDATRLPVSQEPARKGPVIPEGVVYIFAIEKSYQTGIPVFFGSVENDFTIESWMNEYSCLEFLNIFKDELNNRASSKKKLLLSQERLEELGCSFDYSKSTLDGLYSIINTMVLDHEISEVDFEISNGEWVKLNIQEAREILVCINKSIQSLYSWNYGIHSEIKSSSTLEELLLIQETIIQYSGTLDDY